MVWVVQPTGPGGASLGNIAKVGTVYYDGMVYIGTNDGNRDAGYAVRSSDGAPRYGLSTAPPSGPRGHRRQRRDRQTPAPRGARRSNGQSCALTGGRRALDPPGGRPGAEPGVLDVRQRAQLPLVAGRRRPGDNLFGNSMVASTPRPAPTSGTSSRSAMVTTTWTTPTPPVVGEAVVDGVDQEDDLLRQQGLADLHPRPHHRQAAQGVVERPVPQDSRQTDVPSSRIRRTALGQDCIVYEPLSTEQDSGRSVPGGAELQRLPSRSASGRQPPLVYTPPNYLDADKPFLTYRGYRGNNGELPTSDNNGGPPIAPPGLPVGPALGSAAAVDDDPERR